MKLKNIKYVVGILLVTMVAYAAADRVLNTTTLIFKEASPGANLITIQPPSFSSDYTITLPTANGTSGQIMANDGAGNLSWITATGASNAVTGPGASTDGQIVVFNGTTGYALKTNSGTGIARLSSGVLSTSTGISLTGTDISGTLGLANGGLGTATLTSNNVLLGNGNGSPLFVAPSTSGNVLVSNGTTWTSNTIAGAGDVVGVASSVSGEVVLFSSTTGKAIGRAIGTGPAFLTSGVISVGTFTNGGVLFSTASVISTGPVGTSGQILKSNGAAAPSWLTVLPEANGGTNQSTYSTGDMLYATGSNTLGKLAVGSDGTATITSGGIPTKQVPAKFADVQFNDQAGLGSTATKIPYYTTSTVSNGNGIFLVSNDATNGTKIVFLRPALVTASIGYYTSTVGAQFGVSLNGAVTTNLYSDTDAHRKCLAQPLIISATAYASSTSCSFVVTTNDIVRPHTDGSTCGDPNSCFFNLSAVALPPF